MHRQGIRVAQKLRLSSQALFDRRYASHAAASKITYPTTPPSPPSSSSSSSPTSKTPPSSPTASTSTLPKPRLNISKIIADPTATTRNHILRASPIPEDTVFHITRLHTTSNELRRKLDSVKSKQKDVGALIRAGGGEEALRQAKKLKTRVVEYEKVLEETEKELGELASGLPNDTHPSTPVGLEDQAIEVETFGPELIPSDKRRDHLNICLHYDWLDPPSSALSTGTSWPYLKGELALLELALVNYSLSKAIKSGWTPILTPDVIKEDILSRCGFQPRDPSQTGQTYYLTTSNPSQEDSTPSSQPTLCLAATSEIPLAALSANKILPSSIYTNPHKYVGLSHAFRAEAGARGADTRGLYRLHQFTKVELFAVTAGENDVSEKMMQEMRILQKSIVEGLGLSVRVLDMPTRELGASAWRKFDVEAWMPGRGKWGEISSTSNCTDYQSRRLHIRHRNQVSEDPSSKSSATSFAHTLNGTAAAIPRLLLALIENGARFKEGSGDSLEGLEGLDLPKALEGYYIAGEEIGMGGAKKGLIRWV